jgi:hypothetical protein
MVDLTKPPPPDVGKNAGKGKKAPTTQDPYTYLSVMNARQRELYESLTSELAPEEQARIGDSRELLGPKPQGRRIIGYLRTWLAEQQRVTEVECNMMRR